MPVKIKGKMAVALGGDVHYVDMPDSEEELVQMLAEPKIDTIATLDSGSQFIDEASAQSKEEVAQARKQMSKNELMHLDEASQAKIRAQKEAIEDEKRHIMVDGLIHKDDGTILDPQTHQVVDGANFGE